MENLSVRRIATLAHELGVYASSDVEVSMGRKLAKYVTPKAKM